MMTGDIADAGHGRSISWRSRGTDPTSAWWTSAVELSSSVSSSAKELSSTFASKMDQVPTTLAGFTLPWHAGAKDQPKSQLQRGSSFSTFTLPWKQALGGNKPMELPKPAEGSPPSTATKPVEESPQAPEAPKPAEVSPSLNAEVRILSSVGESPKPAEDSPRLNTDIRSLSRVGESRRKTKRMSIDLAPCATDNDRESPCAGLSPHSIKLSSVSQRFLLGDSLLMNSTESKSMEGLNRLSHQVSLGVTPEALIKEIDQKSVISSSRRSSHKPSLSMSLGPLFEDIGKRNPLHVLPEPPGHDGVVHVSKVEGSLAKDEIFPGNTNALSQLKVGLSTSKSTELSAGLSKHPVVGGSARVAKSSELVASLSKHPVVGGSTRVMRHCEEVEEDMINKSNSLPSTPQANVESRTSKLMRKLKLGWGSRVRAEVGNLEAKSGKRTSPSMTAKLVKEKGSRAVSELVVSQHQKFARNLETTKNQTLEITNGDEAEAIVQTQNHSGINRVEYVEKKSAIWPFKWKWNGKSSPRSTKRTNRRHDTPKLYEASRKIPEIPKRFEQTSPSAEIMSDARDTFLNKSDRFSSTASAERLGIERAPRHRRGLSWGSSATPSALFTPSQPWLRSRDAQGLLLPPRRLPLPTTTDAMLCEEAKTHAHDDGARSSTDGEIFEDCNGHFGGTESPRKSVTRDSYAKKRTPSMESIEWDSHSRATSQREQPLTIGDVAALCNSPLKFVFKCREIEHFNKFLRKQKKLLRNGTESTKRFAIVRSGTDLEVSSMVAAICYSWFLENTVPKRTGDPWHAVPVIDIPRHHMHKHRDAAWLFYACGIDAGALLFSNEIDLGSLVAAGRIKTSIIGQDVLVTRNEYRTHHLPLLADVKVSGERWQLVTAMQMKGGGMILAGYSSCKVGSVCTLLAEKFFAEAQSLLQARYVKTLLLAGILLDTENLDFASIRDTDMTTALLVGSGSLGRNGFFDQLRQVEDDAKVAKLMTRQYGDANQLPGRPRSEEEADHEHSDKESFFSHSQDQTSTSEAGTSSSMDEDSPRFIQHASFKHSKLLPHSAPARSHRLPSPSGVECNEDAKAVAQIRKSATHSASSGPLTNGNECRRTRSSSFTRLRKILF